MDRDEVANKYLTDDRYDSIDLIVLMKRFQGEYVPTIRIKGEIKKYWVVGVNEKIALPKGVLIQILRKWVRVKDDRRGKRVFPHLYHANPD